MSRFRPTERQPQALVSSTCSECGAPVRFAPGQGQVRCSHCDGGLAISDGLLIRLSCPRCGGNFYYLDGSMCGRCPYCDASLLALTRQRVLRYLVAPAVPAPDPAAELCLLPFWRLNALSLGWDLGKRRSVVSDSRPTGDESGDALPSVTVQDSGPLKEFRGRTVDLALPDAATTARGIGSLRLRAAVFPAEPFAAEHQQLGRLVAPTMGVAEARETLCARALSWGSAIEGLQLECQRVELVVPSLSLLFYPFWLRSGHPIAGDSGEGRADLAAWDAVNGEPEALVDSRTCRAGGALSPGAPVAASPSVSATTGADFDTFKVVELVCGHCRGPLPGGNSSFVFPCQQCGSFWVDDDHASELTPFTGRWAQPQIEPPGSAILWLPFWRLSAVVRWAGREASTAAELRTVLNVMQPRLDVPVEPGDSPLVYYAPAYGSRRSPRLDFAARDMTRLQPRLAEGPTGNGEAFHCFYAPDDARKLAYVVWLQLLTGAVPRLVRSLRVRTGEVELWYVPFGDQGRELVSLVTGLRYDRSTFAGVRH